MLSEPQRQTIIELHAKGMGVRQLSRTLGHTRRTVRRVLTQGAPRPPRNRPPATNSPALTSTLPALYCETRGNVVRMQELLRERHGQEVPYSTLTHWVRQAQLRDDPPARVGHYDFAPGQEMQHDTSPHRLHVGGVAVTAQCAGLLLGFSRDAFILYYPRFTRFEAQVFLNDPRRWPPVAVRFHDRTATAARRARQQRSPAVIYRALGGSVFLSVSGCISISVEGCRCQTAAHPTGLGARPGRRQRP